MEYGPTDEEKKITIAKIEMGDFDLVLDEDQRSGEGPREAAIRVVNEFEKYCKNNGILPEKISEAIKKRKLKIAGSLASESHEYSVEELHSKLVDGIESGLKTTFKEKGKFRFNRIDTNGQLTSHHAEKFFKHNGKGIKVRRVKETRI